ncbi:MAG: DUF6328 family protein [Methylocella sp.]
MSLVEKTKTALDESRTLTLGAQVLLGFQLQAPFQNAFTSLTPHEKTIEVAVLCLMALVLGLLIAPSARHRIVGRGDATADINQFVSRMSLATLFPFAIALALDLVIAGTRVAGPRTGAAAGVVGGLVAIGFWYGPFVIKYKERGASMPNTSETTSTATKIDYVLIEARVVLPGVQALLGFQLAIVLTSGFAELPPSAKALHGVALGLVALAMILLMTPAAYHRIVYGGALAPDFYRVASRFLLAATVFLALGLSADIDVVVSKIIESEAIASALALTTAATLLGLWQAWPWWRHRKNATANSSR